jgi:hypothetical protein
MPSIKRESFIELAYVCARTAIKFVFFNYFSSVGNNASFCVLIISFANHTLNTISAAMCVCMYEYMYLLFVHTCNYVYIVILC